MCERDCAVSFFALGEVLPDFKDRSHGQQDKACKDKQAAKVHADYTVVQVFSTSKKYTYHTRQIAMAHALNRVFT